MKKVTDYINSGLSGLPESKLLYRFRKQLTEEVTERANELSHRGLKDEAVLAELIISEHPDIRGEFDALLAKEKAKKRAERFARFHVLGIIAYSLLLLCAFFLALSGGAAHSWLILEGGFSFLAVYLFSLAIAKLSRVRSVFHPLSRILLAVNVMTVATFLFLLLFFVFGWEKSYLVFLGGAVGVLIADAVYAAASHQKFAIAFRLLYVPMAAALLYVILCLSGAAHWNPAWIMIPASLLIDLLAVMIRIAINGKKSDEMEVEEEWS